MKKAKIPIVSLYTKAECSLCDKAKIILKQVSCEIQYHLIEIDITKDTVIFGKFCEQIPVIFINDKKAFKYHVDREKLQKKLLRCK